MPPSENTNFISHRVLSVLTGDTSILDLEELAMQIEDELFKVNQNKEKLQAFAIKTKFAILEKELDILYATIAKLEDKTKINTELNLLRYA